MQVTDNPKELRRAIGVRAVADVVRTLDKLTIRREYHESLSRNDVSLDFIVGGIKTIAQTSDKDATRLKAYQTLLRSIGLERYEDIEDKGKGWEEMLVDMQQKQISNGGNSAFLPPTEGDYDVNTPSVPAAEESKQNAEKELGRQLYGI